MSEFTELPEKLVKELDAYINREKKATGKWLTLADQEKFVQDWFDEEEQNEEANWFPNLAGNMDWFDEEEQNEEANWFPNLTGNMDEQEQD